MKTVKKNNRPTGSGYCYSADTQVHPLLKDYFSYCFYKSALIMREQLVQRITEFGLVPHHLGILRLLSSLGEHAQNQLGEQLGIDKATMVKLIDQLEDLKLIERKQDKKDRRIWSISITSSGAKILEKVSKIRHEVENDFMSCLTEAERKVLLKCIPELLDKNRDKI